MSDSWWTETGNFVDTVDGTGQSNGVVNMVKSMYS